MRKYILQRDRPHITLVHFMLDTQGYKHTLTIRNTHCFPTTAIVTWTHLNVTLYVHWLSRFFWDALVGLLILPSGTGMLSRSVGHKEPTDPVQPPRSEKMLTTPQREPNITHNFIIIVNDNNFSVVSEWVKQWKQFIYALFWEFTESRVVTALWRFGTNYRSFLQGSSRPGRARISFSSRQKPETKAINVTPIIIRRNGCCPCIWQLRLNRRPTKYTFSVHKYIRIS
jgi:hypothetical protein